MFEWMSVIDIVLYSLVFCFTLYMTFYYLIGEGKREINFLTVFYVLANLVLISRLINFATDYN